MTQDTFLEWLSLLQCEAQLDVAFSSLNIPPHFIAACCICICSPRHPKRKLLGQNTHSNRRNCAWNLCYSKTAPNSSGCSNQTMLQWQTMGSPAYLFHREAQNPQTSMTHGWLCHCPATTFPMLITSLRMTNRMCGRYGVVQYRGTTAAGRQVSVGRIDRGIDTWVHLADNHGMHAALIAVCASASLSFF